LKVAQLYLVLVQSSDKQIGNAERLARPIYSFERFYDAI